MTSEQFFFCCYNRSTNFFYLGMYRANFFYSNFFWRGGGLKLSLYVFHHNNNFNLINIYSTKTITIENKKITDLFTV